MKLDHLIGKQVTEIQRLEDDSGIHWTVVFEGGESFNSSDAGLEISNDIQGTNLLSVTDGGSGTVVQFGNSVQDGDPNVVGEYTLTDYTVGQGEDPPPFPATADEAATELPEDPSPERVLDGP